MPINQLTEEGFGMMVGSAGASFTGLLDEYGGAAAAYSVRRLSSTYEGSLIRVREDGGDTEADIGYTANGDLDTTDLLAHCGANSGFITTWYDQSGNANHATQSTDSLQPLIVNSGVLNTLGVSSLPAINFNDDYLDTPSTSDLQGFLDVYKSWNSTKTANVQQIPIASITSGNIFYQYSNTSFLQNGKITSIDIRDSVHRLTNFYHDGTNGYINHNETDYSAIIPGYNNNSNARVWRIGAYPGGALFNVIGNFQEFIIYSGNQAANKDGIKSNINSYFSIY